MIPLLIKKLRGDKSIKIEDIKAKLEMVIIKPLINYFEKQDRSLNSTISMAQEFLGGGSKSAKVSPSREFKIMRNK